MLTMPFPFASVRLTSDAFGACLGAFGGEEGAILIAGTGSAGLIYRHGQLHTCSGRGFPISDLGSGAWLGLRAIQQSLLCHDGILPPSTLAIRLLDHFKRDQAEVVRWAARAIPADYGRFAPGCSMPPATATSLPASCWMKPANSWPPCWRGCASWVPTG